MVVTVQRIPAAQSLLDNVFGLGNESFDRLLHDRVWQGERQFPPIDIAEYDNESVVIAELPGVNKSDVSISVHKGVLTISGARKELTLPENSSWVRREVEAGTFSRSITISHEVETGGVTAELSNGLLKIVLPKAENAKPKEITIR